MYYMQHTNFRAGRIAHPVANRHSGTRLGRMATFVLVCLATLAGCGGGGGGSSGSAGGNVTTNDPCSVTARNQ